MNDLDTLIIDLAKKYDKPLRDVLMRYDKEYVVLEQLYPKADELFKERAALQSIEQFYKFSPSHNKIFRNF